MRISPAERHRQKVEAGRRSETAREGAQDANATAYEKQLMKLESDLRLISEIKSTDAKIEKKRELIADYQGWIDGALTNPAPTQDVVLVTMMIWLIDVGDYAGALPVIAHALRHDMKMPERFNRDLPTFVLESIAEAAMRERQIDKRIADKTADVLLQVYDAVQERDIHDKPRAKAEKAIGLALADDDNADIGTLNKALSHLKEALRLDDTCGVKGEITRLEKRIAGLRSA